MIGWLFVLLLLIPSMALSAVSYVTSATMVCTACTSLSVSSFTVVCGTGDALIFGSASLTGVSTSVSSATYNAAALTFKASAQGSSRNKAESWFKVAPSIGTSASMTMNFNDANSHIVIAASSFCGVDQTTPTGTAVTQGTTSNTISNTVTVPVNGMAIEHVAGDEPEGPATVVAGGGTQRWNLSNDAGGVIGAGQTRTTTGTVGWDFATTTYCGHVAVPINSATVAAGSYAPRRRF